MDKTKLTTETYNEISQLYAEQFATPSEHIDDFLDLLNEGNMVLDAGCGPGVDSDYIFNKGYKVIGVDVSDKMLELARKRNSNIKYFNLDIREMKFEADFFDGIVASFSVIHIPKQDLFQVFKNFNTIMKDDAKIYIGIQEGKSDEIVVDEPLIHGRKLFLNIMSKEELQDLLRDTGFVVVKDFLRLSSNNNEFDYNKLVIIAKKMRI